MEKSYLKILKKSLNNHWNLPVFSNYRGVTYTYGDFAKRMTKLRLLLEEAGLQSGDRVALIGKNSAEWAMNLFGIMAAGYVAVPILPDFKPDNVHHIVKHSGARALIVTTAIWDNLSLEELSGLDIILKVDTLAVIHALKLELKADNIADNLFRAKYPSAFSQDDMYFYNDQPEELAMISYTSGTSGFSKGVMIPHRALWNNMQYAYRELNGILTPGANVVSILPMAHMYGLAFEVYTEICKGCHVHFLTRAISAGVLLEAFKDLKPVLIVMVPLLLEKIVRKSIIPLLETRRIQILTGLPIIRQRIFSTIREKLCEALGGNFFEVVVGGAALSSDVEKVLKLIKFPYTVGYGMTECAPLVSYAHHYAYKQGSVGKAIDGMQIRIDVTDEQTGVGEIQTKGDCVMLGYYQNETATREAFTDDGWLRTGDLGILTPDGTVYIKGRSKNMLLGSNGQNIYPEEIESPLMAFPYIAEAIVVSRGDKLVALIHPDYDLLKKDGHKESDAEKIVADNIAALNQTIPAYCKINSFEIHTEEFEKTPKHSIKRFMYQ